MCGGLAVISDVPKTMVYSLSRIANAGTTAPSPNRSSKSRRPPSCVRIRKDSDSLPPYDVLDGILRLYIEDFRSVGEVAAELVSAP
jgi:NAD+ synthase (glutamine-hydrolysing)